MLQGASATGRKTEGRRKSICRITAWASALYALHIVGLNDRGLAKLKSYMMCYLRFLLRSYSQDTKETNNCIPEVKMQLLSRLKTFLGWQRKSDEPELSSLYLPRAVLLEQRLRQVWEDSAVQETTRELLLTCEECGVVYMPQAVHTLETIRGAAG